MSAYYEDNEVRRKIDAELHRINALRAQMLGIDSTEQDRAEFNLISKQYHDRIKILDLEFYNETFL